MREAREIFAIHFGVLVVRNIKWWTRKNLLSCGRGLLRFGAVEATTDSLPWAPLRPANSGPKMKNFLIIGFIVSVVAWIGCGARPDNTSEAVDSAVAEANDVSLQNALSTGRSRDLRSSAKLSTKVGISKPESIANNIDAQELAPEKKEERHDLQILSWNVESEGADGNVIAEQLTELNDEDRYDVVGLTEVLPKDLGKFRDALGQHYKYAFTKSGYNDRMQLLYNENKFEKIRHFEIDEINIKNRYRAPLVVHLKNRKTGLEFLVMINHLARGKAEIRQQQAKMLVEWARDESLPIVAIGDYNFDYVFETDKGNPAFVNFMRDNVWSWVKPEEMIDTNWYDNPEAPDGADDYPGSMLDFGFVANGAKEWKRICRVLVRKNDFPDDKTTSDHRPFELFLTK